MGNISSKLIWQRSHKGTMEDKELCEEMKNMTERLNQLLKNGLEYISQSSELELAKKPSPEKWSKKEILGHLIDSGINNLQRFTEIQFESKPYKIRKYKQDKLVVANHYQESEITELTDFWLAINKRIINLIDRQTEGTLNYQIEIDDGEFTDLKLFNEKQS